jgi:hypothetical protein
MFAAKERGEATTIAAAAARLVVGIHATSRENV